ncbi:MAG: glucose-6-phosphate isomerase, partial [Armatimonadetes bacterium]|nr:glucose-6-phosphate isomerase [Armatimonadota bacterium]
MASRPTRSRSQSEHDIFAVLEKQAFSERLWRKDPTVWRQGPKGAKVIRNRLGWLNVVETMMPRAAEITRFADDIKAAGFTHAVLMGMGGSSLSPEVSSLTFGVRPGYPDLMVLDSTVPASVLKIEGRIDPARTLFIVAMKSGATVETNSCYRYFHDRVRARIGDRAGDNFAAITDPGTSLEAEAHRNRFRDLFLNFADIGGRYSALSYFGLVPAAIIGVDIARLLDRALSMMKACGPDVSPSENPGIALGAMLAEHAMQGRNKMTLVLSPEIRSFGYWVEQLVAESTGKNGTGILPVESEFVADPGLYGDDRVFVYLRLKTSNDTGLDRGVGALEQAGRPVIKIALDDVYDLGKEYFRWEMATAVASALLGVNPFDEPNVKESKDNTRWFLRGPEKHHMLPKERPIAS